MLERPVRSVRLRLSQRGRTGFFEGCWSGPFEAFAFDRATHVFGSGGFVEAGRVTLVASSHPLEAVFVLSVGDEVLASNSLAFVVRRGGIDIVKARELYGRYLSVLGGPPRCDRVPLEDDRLRLERLVREQAVISDGMMTRVAMPCEPAVANYAGYRQRLRDVVGACVANAGDPRRRRRYTALATISSGYDSVAAAAVAREAGCRDAITIAGARYGLDDSGAAAAAALGLACDVVERPAYGTGAQSDAEFLATFCPGDRMFAAFDGRISGRLLVTGHHGDMAWSMKGEDDGPYRRSGGGSGMGLCEFRLRNDCLLLPIPMIGASRVADLRAISRGAEMTPFRVDDAYDRPIPRRIAQDVGVPGEVFGRRKAVASRAFWEGGFAAGTMREADAAVLAMLAPAARRRERLSRLTAAALGRALRGSEAERVGRFARLRFTATRRLADRLSQRLNQRPYRELMTLWAIAKVGERYGPSAEV